MTDHERYWFRPWVYGSISDDQLILLDLKKDEYYFVDKSEMRALSQYVEVDMAGWPADRHAGMGGSGRPDILMELIKAGALTDQADLGKVLTDCLVAPPINPFEHIECDDYPSIRWHHVILAFGAGLAAHVLLRFFRLETIVRSIGGRETGNPEKALALGRVYKLLRPILPRSRICLYDTLAFTLFCRFYGVRPKIVFGVTGDPFQAHCWAQLGRLILNDVPQNIRLYTPIMTV